MSIRAIKWAYDLFAQVDIPPQERSILMALCYHHHEKTGACFPSYDTIALLSGYRRRRVIQGVDKLVSWGLVSKSKRRAGSRQGSNQFALFGRYTECRRGHPENGSPECTKKHPESKAARVQTGAPDKEVNNNLGADPLKVIPMRRAG